MIRPLFSVVSQGAAIDAVTQLASVFEILEGLTAEGFPVLVQRLVFFVLWTREADDPQRVAGRFTVTHAGRELLSEELQVDFQTNLRNRFTARIAGIVIPGPGAIVFRMTLATGVEATYSVDVVAAAGALHADIAQRPGGVAQAAVANPDRAAE